jgi:hypothetical protein
MGAVELHGSPTLAESPAERDALAETRVRWV